MVQLSTDGPNANLKLLFYRNTHIKSTLPSEKQILNINTCLLHIVNGAYKTERSKVGWTINKFQRVTYRQFKNFPSKRAIYTQVTGSSVYPKKFCAVRWTGNSFVMKRSIEMLPNLNTYVKNPCKNKPNMKLKVC